eukprot:9774927-Prorocentrum_lima.AAC.1
MGDLIKQIVERSAVEHGDPALLGRAKHANSDCSEPRLLANIPTLLSGNVDRTRNYCCWP